MRYSIIFIFFVLCGCDRDTVAPDLTSVGFAYFPLEVGDFRVYEVHQEEFSIFAESDTFDYQLKELVADSFATQDQITYVLHRFSRDTADDPWELDSVWTARRTANHAIVVENNIALAKLIFPATLNRIWDSNVFNTRPPDEFEITEIDGTLQTPAGTFDRTLTVFENNEPDTLIFQDIRKAIYAPGIGLISRSSSILDFCNTDPACLGTLEFGTNIDLTLIEYGKE